MQKINFTLRDNEETDTQNSSGPRDYVVDHLWAQEGPWELTADQELVLELLMPLPFNDQDIATAKEALTDTLPEGKMGKFVGGMFSMALHVPKHIRRYLVQASAHVAGAKRSAKAGKDIRFGGSFYEMPTRITFGG
ncbi:hypothetical protein [Arthrobacter sp. MYb227]|uniref:hypothetical protein n=1 Tax=Arthrobacter sp. MYb227 TaxID=1848601 RepID=UPI0011B0BC80|nr:hypothetical protein [Arthrobacter sp. MYb227]